jgi:hypothetical protein
MENQNCVYLVLSQQADDMELQRDPSGNGPDVFMVSICFSVQS